MMVFSLERSTVTLLPDAGKVIWRAEDVLVADPVLVLISNSTYHRPKLQEQRWKQRLQNAY